MKKIVRSAIKNSEYDLEVLIYGMKLLLFNGVTILMIFIISYILDNLTYGSLFLISFAIIRIAIGGYHCKTPIKCLISTSALYIMSIILYRINIYKKILLIGSIFLLLILFIILETCKNYLLLFIYIFLYIVMLENVRFFTPVFSGLLFGLVLYFVKQLNEKFKKYEMKKI